MRHGLGKSRGTAPCVGVSVASEYRLQPEVNKGLQAREALFCLKKRGHGSGAEAPEPLPPEGGTPAVAASHNMAYMLCAPGVLSEAQPITNHKSKITNFLCALGVLAVQISARTVSLCRGGGRGGSVQAPAKLWQIISRCSNIAPATGVSRYEGFRRRDCKPCICTVQ